MERARLSDHDPRIRIILPPPRATKVEHEVASATCAGAGHEWNGDALSIFTLGVPSEDWNGLVLAVADGEGWPARGDLASAIAVEALEDGLTGWAEQADFSSHGWQDSVAQALMAAFEHAHAKVRDLLDGAGSDPGRGVALTAAALFGDWLCVAHAGDSRVYRLSKHELEQVTADQGDAGKAHRRTLGRASHVAPALRFVHLKAGDVVLVCSDGLCRHLDGEHLAESMNARRPIAEVAQGIVAAASVRGAADDLSACVARVRRLPARPLPEPTTPMDAAQVTEALTLPRYRLTSLPALPSRRLGAILGALALVAAVVGGTWFLGSSRTSGTPVVLADTVLRTSSGGKVPMPEPVPPVAVESVTPAPPPARDTTGPRPVELVPGDSLEIIERQIKDLRERRRSDSLAAEKQKREAARARDSLIAAQETEAAEDRVRDSLTMVTRREEEARQRRAAEAKAEQERREADLRAQQAAAAASEAESAREAKLAAGRAALEGWMRSVVSNVNAGNVGAPVLAAGPPGFPAFVDKMKPRLSDAKVVSSSVTEESGEATAEWAAKWRSDFGTSITRRMRATATIVPAGEEWRLRSWRIIEGAP